MSKFVQTHEKIKQVSVEQETLLIRQKALERLEELARYLLPQGNKQGPRWLVGSADGERGSSFDINFREGWWKDWASGDKASRSPFDLWSAVRKVDFTTARRDLAAWLGIPLQDREGSEPITTPKANSIHVNGHCPWHRYADAITEDHKRELAQWRGFTPVYVDHLVSTRQIGRHGASWALPVVHEGKIVAAHYRIPPTNGKDKPVWLYEPRLSAINVPLQPLTKGNLESARVVHCHESQWDQFALDDRLSLYEQPDVASVSTRGATNAKLLSACIPETVQEIILWPQSDPAGEKWLTDAKDTLYGRSLKVARVPSPHKDLSEWVKGGATASNLLDAIKGSEVVQDDDDDLDAPFPVDALPSPFFEMAVSIAKSANVPVVLPALAILSLLSASIGKKLQVQSGPDQTTPGMLFIFGFAESGTGKTKASRHALAPLLAIQEEIQREWRRNEFPKKMAKAKRVESQINSIESQMKRNPNRAHEFEGELERLIREKEELSRNTSPKLWTEDVTVERLASLMEENGEQMTLFSEDASKPLQNLLGRYNPSKKPDDSLIVKSYSMAPTDVERLSRPPASLSAPAISLFWLTQPDKIPEIFSNQTLKDGGFLPRCLVADTKVEPEERTGNEKPINKELLQTFTEGMKCIFSAFRLNPKTPRIIEAEPEVNGRMTEHWNAVVRRRKTDLRDISIFAARWTENTWRLALNLHVAKHGECAADHPLEIESAEAAIRIHDWFCREQLRLLQSGRELANAGKLDALKAKIDAYGKEGSITMRELLRSGWDEPEVRRIVQASRGTLALQESKGVGRHSLKIMLA